MSKAVSLAAAAEAAEGENQPLYLVEIELDSGTDYYTNNNEDVVFPTSGGNTYATWGFAFDRIRSTLTGEIDRVSFAFDNSDLTLSGYLATEDFQGRTITLKRVFSNLLADSDDATTLFSGEIGPIQITDGEFSFIATSPLLKLELQVPRRLFQQNCQWAFDSTECRGYNIAGTVAGTTLAVEKVGTVNASSTTILVLDSARTEANDYWRSGIIEFTSGALDGKKAHIASSTSGNIHLLVPLPSAPAAAVTYKIKRGCSKSSWDCIHKFDNFHNFGGFSAIPERAK